MELAAIGREVRSDGVDAGDLRDPRDARLDGCSKRVVTGRYVPSGRGMYHYCQPCTRAPPRSQASRALIMGDGIRYLRGRPYGSSVNAGKPAQPVSLDMQAAGKRGSD